LEPRDWRRPGVPLCQGQPVTEDEYRQWLIERMDRLAVELTEWARATWGLPDDMRFEWGKE